MTPPRLLSSLVDSLLCPHHGGSGVRRVKSGSCKSQVTEESLQWSVFPSLLDRFLWECFTHRSQKVMEGSGRWIGYFVCLLLEKALWMQKSTLTICPEHVSRTIASHTPPPNTCTHNHTKPANTDVHVYLCTRMYTRHTHEYISYIPFWFAFLFYGKNCDQKQLGKEKMYFNV